VKDQSAGVGATSPISGPPAKMPWGPQGPHAAVASGDEEQRLGEPHALPHHA
jgi:hypothetical protein